MPKNTSGLIPWKPGQSGNPAGRKKKGETFTDVLRARLAPEKLAAKLEELIEAGDVAALKYAYDRVDGTPTQTIKAAVYQEAPAVVAELRELRSELESEAD